MKTATKPGLERLLTPLTRSLPVAAARALRDEDLRASVRRAKHCCEYCRLPQAHSPVPFQIEHLGAQQHKGPTALPSPNLVWPELTSREREQVAGDIRRAQARSHAGALAGGYQNGISPPY